jgi:hypothetical protein
MLFLPSIGGLASDFFVFFTPCLRISEMTSKDDVFISLETRINGKLVANAAKEAKRQSKILDDSEGYTKLKWTDSCQEVLKAFHSDYYLHVRKLSQLFYFEPHDLGH